MRSVAVLLVCVAFMSLVGCSSLQVSTDYDPTVDFSKYKTFGWPEGERPPEDALAKHPLLAKRIVFAINNALQAKGYGLMETGVPDLVIVTHGGVEEKMQVTTWDSHGYGGYGGYYGGHYGGYGMYDPWGGYGSQTDVTYYEEGTLLIDFVDTETRDMVWRGLGTKILGGSSSPEDIQKKVDQIVEKMLAAYPPQ